MRDKPQSFPHEHQPPAPSDFDEGGLRAPPELAGWRKAWWWFHFLILVKLARLRFVAVLVVIGAIITQWDTLAAYYEKWTRPEKPTQASGDFEWFCPMHPSVIRESGQEKCPICFMPLSKRKKGAVHDEALPAGVVNRVQLSPYRVVLAGIRTLPVDFQSLIKEITAVGYVEFNERAVKNVSARVKGRIDTLEVNETGQIVDAGDVLASVYSPELLVTVQNLLVARKNNNVDQLNSVRTRLQLLGISDDQIDEIVQTGKSNTHLKIRSPITGHVIKKYVREGQYVDEGGPLYDVADLSTVWIQAQIYEDDLAFLPSEQIHKRSSVFSAEPLYVTATTRAFPDEEFRGVLTFIYPHVDQETRTVSVRFELDNPGHKLRPGTTVTVRLKVPPREISALRQAARSNREMLRLDLLEQGLVLAIPESSVIDTGSQTIVYRQSLPGVFEGVRVILGPRMSGPDDVAFYPVLRGLARGDLVVTAGSFLVDAETRLNPAAGSVYFGGSSGSKGDSTSSATVRPSTPEDPDAKIGAALARLDEADRRLAEQQQFCPVLVDNRLGSMGVPVKLVIENEAVFLCCEGCRKSALENPEATLATVRELRESKRLPADQWHPKSSTDRRPDPEAEIQNALAQLPETDRSLAQKQRYCAVLPKNRLGSMGPPVKLMVSGQPVFLCCDGCRDAALAEPAQTLQQVDLLKKSPP
ncbi:MAG: efflux RND transporter periplasmic adaptor subunit [Planctomycetaceae bacterium]